MKQKIKITILGALMASLLSCNDLEINDFQRVSDETQYRSEAFAMGITANVYYEALASVWWWGMFAQEVSGDALVMPQRPGHWAESSWAAIQQHKISPAQGWPIDASFSNYYRIISISNKAVEDLSHYKVKYVEAEARAIRAYTYMLAFDLYRNIPLVTSSAVSADTMPQAKPIDIFNFIESELLYCREALKDRKNDANWFPRMTWGAVSGLLARHYLNAEVYTGTPQYDKCLAVCNEIIDSKQYSLHNGNWYELFSTKNGQLCKDEILYFMDIVPESMEYRHTLYVQCGLDDIFKTKYAIPYALYGGLSIEKHFYETLEDGDIRKYRKGTIAGLNPLWDEQGTLYGPMLDAKGDTMVSPTRKTKVIYNHIQQLKTTDFFLGAKMNKFEPDQNGSPQGEPHNGQPIVRYADILLMKAECLIRQGGPNSTADNLVNAVRTRCINKPLSNVTLDMLFDERGREFVMEGLRRMDQIRFNKWVNHAEFIDDFNKPGLDQTTDGEFSKIWPIPQKVLDTNKKMKQNTGY